MRPGAATITQIPKPEECAPIAAFIPQAKGSGEDSPPLPLTPSHLLHTSQTAIYFTDKWESGCVRLLANALPPVV